MMLEPSRHPENGALMLSAADSPARMFPLRGDELALMVNEVGYGARLPESFAFFDLESCAWRTSQVCLTGERDEFSETWPSAGTMRNGRLYRRARWVRHLCVTGCSLWPSPRASDRDNCGGSNARSKAKRNGTYVGRLLNPEFQENLMGFPIGWTDLQPLETPSFPKLPSGSAEES